MNKVKKITNLSAIVLVVASTIGAGIFFKNQGLGKLAKGDLGFLLASWGVGIFGIMALGFALVELSSAQKTNKGTLEWTKRFTPAWFHHFSSKYNRFVLMPITAFALSIYIVSTFVDAGWAIKNGYLALLVGFAIFMLFTIINLVSLKAAEISQWVSKGIQLIPLLVLPLIALINPLDGSEIVQKTGDGWSVDGFAGVSKWMVLIAGIPAIAFAYDGFYTVASLRQDLEHPEHIGKISFFGILAISAFYIYVTVGFIVGSSSGSMFGISGISDVWMSMFNIFIACGMMGIVNGYTMGAISQYSGQMDDNEVPEISWLYNWMFNKRKFFASKNWSHQQKSKVTSIVYFMITTTLYYLIIGPVGTSLYSEGWDGNPAYYINAIGEIESNFYGAGALGADSLYAFIDLATNFSSMIMFTIIASAILGGIVNRKTKKVEVTKSKIFLPAAWVGVIMMYSSFIYMFLTTIINMTGFNNADSLNATIEFASLLLYIGIALVPTLIEIKMGKIKNGEYVKNILKDNNEIQTAVPVEQKAE